jgi:recombinational DNA repair protein RecT
MSEEKANIAVSKHLESLKAIEIASDSRVSKKFVELYKTIHGTNGEAIYQKERFNYEKMLQENSILQECTKLSLYGAFLDISVNGLSLDTTSRPLCYLMTRNFRVKGQNGQDTWEKRAYIKVSPLGEILYRKRTGQIKNADNPQIVYEGDTIRVGLNPQGKHIVKEHERLIPRKPNARILGGYMRIERHDGTFECTWMDVSETERLREYSNKNNRGTDTDDKSNKLYTSYNGQIDPGFFEAKIVRHAFDSYPAVKMGQFTVLESHEEPEAVIDYGIQEQTIETTAQDVTNEPGNGSFDSAPAPQQGTVTFEEDGGAF